MCGSEKLKLLVWKNLVLQRRHKWQTLFEVTSPVLLSLLLLVVRALVAPETQPARLYPPFEPTYFNKSLIDMGNSKQMSIAYSPDSKLTRSVVSHALTAIGGEETVDNLFDVFGSIVKVIATPDPVGYKNSSDMEAALTRPKAMDEILCGVQFDDSMTNATKWPDEVVVTLRFPAIMRMAMKEHPMVANWRTNLLFPLFPQSGPREPGDMYGGKTPGYSAEMFLAVQHGISEGIIKQKSGKPSSTKVYLQRLPQVAFREDPLLVVLERFISIVIIMGFSYTFVNTVRVITIEKELQLKETMSIMGLPTWLHWVAWFIKQFSFLLVSAVLMVIMFKIPLNKTSTGEWYSILTYTPWSIVLFFMVLFIIASLSFSFMVSVFFSRANSAASFMGLIWFASFAVFMFTQLIHEQVSFTSKMLMCLISNTAIGFGLQMLVWCEGDGKGLQWENMFRPISYHDEFQPGHVALLLLLDAALYMLVAVYVEKIRPGIYGVPLPWYFPFTKSFWASTDTPVPNAADKDEANLEYNDALLKVPHDEEPGGVVPIGVNIKNLSKVFKGRRKAVDNLNLRFYENEITVLLGHNGAGKTTTISMLTGLVPPTSGAVTVSGYNIVTETELARRSLGICPQHNVLFPDLTVAEHIVFYSRLKGMSQDKIDAEVDHFVKLLNLEEKRNVESEKLSGGQKRRLSVAAAMCGASRVVLLDEPTSGLDPAARRSLWDLLLKEKKGRTIILTTHFMDEADVLADRVAVMSGGQLKCYGTPYFLKKHYGVGYKLSILKADTCKVQDVTEFFKAFLPTIRENTNIGSELTYLVPSENMSKFPKMLRELEEKKAALNICSYGLSITSLEEVFMKAGAEDTTEKETTEERHKIKLKRYGANGRYTEDIELTENGNCYNPIDNAPIKKVTGSSLLINHIKAMFLKLVFSTWRSKVTSTIQLSWPIINIIISIILSRSWQFLAELPPLTLNLEKGFNRTQTILAQVANVTDGSVQAKAMNAYKDYFKTSANWDMTLTDIGTMDMGKFYTKLSTTDIPRIRYETLAGATFSNTNITAWFSNYGYHDSAISLSLVNNAILRAHSPGSSLKFINQPLPFTLDSWISVMATGSSMASQFSFNLGFCLGLVSSFIVLFVIKERTSGAKLLQRVSGVRPGVMWCCALAWDWLWLLLVHLLIIATLACFQEPTLATPAELGRALLVLMVFSVGIIPLHYLASFYFGEAATGFTKMCFINTLAGCMPFLVTEVLRMIGSDETARALDYVFSLLPTYSACRSLSEMSVTRFSMMACDGFCETMKLENCTRHTVCTEYDQSWCCIDDNPFLQWKSPGIGRYLLTTVLVGVVAFAILLMKEYELLNKMFYRQALRPVPSLPLEEDSDVTEERRRVANMSRLESKKRSSLVCKDLSKFYGNLLAVNRLTFSVDESECFGLLGINGAGKTSTFRMLTGDSRIGQGDAFVHGLSLKTRLEDVYQKIGYCPQFDALFDNLTARETLHIFCLLRGIPARIGAASAYHLAHSLGFTKHFDKKVRACSGGTKRKISAAVALLGDSPLVFLDEPTTGMDPASKRLVWSSISRAVRAGRSVVLTSHSMEECEALCSRLTVMLGGRLHCLGPLQHLKTKFSQGYTLIVKCQFGPERDTNMAQIEGYIKEQFSGAKLIETYLGISTYSLEDATLPWWRIFDVMEKARVLYPIEDYSVSQTTLEQVFMRFTSQYAVSE